MEFRWVCRYLCILKGDNEEVSMAVSSEKIDRRVEGFVGISLMNILNWIGPRTEP